MVWLGEGRGRKLHNCVPFVAAKAAKPGRSARMGMHHPSRRFEEVAVDVQTITPRTGSGNIKVLVIIDTFTSFARAVAMPDERADTIAQCLLDNWVSVFGPMERLLSDHGPSFMGSVMQELTSNLGIKQVFTSPPHPQANGCVERWNRTLAQDLACFISTGQDDRDSHVSLACLRYNTGVHESTGMSPFKAMFGVDAYEVWVEHEIERAMGEPQDLATHLAALHRKLLARSTKSQQNAARRYDAAVKDVGLKVGDRVLMWSPENASKEGSKIVLPWLGPYVITATPTTKSLVMKAEHGNLEARVHPNRGRRIPAGAVQTGDPRGGVFPDCLRMVRKIRGVKFQVNGTTGTKIRMFRIQIDRRRSPGWTAEHDLPEVVVKLYDTHQRGEGQLHSQQLSAD